jgi:hypothetical protein
MLETSGTIILIDPFATERFIYSVVLNKIKVKVVEHEDFRYVEMALGAKHKLEEWLWVVELTCEIL